MFVRLIFIFLFLYASHLTAQVRVMQIDTGFDIDNPQVASFFDSNFSLDRSKFIASPKTIGHGAMVFRFLSHGLTPDQLTWYPESIDANAGVSKRKSISGKIYKAFTSAFVFTFMKKRALSRFKDCLLYTSPSPRDKRQSRMPSSA